MYLCTLQFALNFLLSTSFYTGCNTRIRKEVQANIQKEPLLFKGTNDTSYESSIIELSYDILCWPKYACAIELIEIAHHRTCI